VRLDIEYIGVNRPDMHFRAGIYPIKPTLPGSRLGMEAVGVVAAVGSQVTGHSVGDRVIAGPIAGQSEHGVYGDVAIVPAAEIIPAFDMLDPAHNTAAWIAYATAYNGLIPSGGLRSGQHVLITAASSNVDPRLHETSPAAGWTWSSMPSAGRDSPTPQRRQPMTAPW
jgi:NADPH:quinone reductase-like Zn-dependent oxidoreductase